MKDLSIWFLVWFGVFCLRQENNKLVGSLKRTRAILDTIGKACDLPNFHAKIDSGLKSPKVA